MPRQIVPPVEATGISAQKPFHPNDQIGLGRFNHQMKMIWHQDIGVNLPAGLDAHFGESRSKALTVRIVEKDRLAPVTATQEVVDRTGVLDSQLSGHHASVVRIALVVNIKNRPLCPTEF